MGLTDTQKFLDKGMNECNESINCIQFNKNFISNFSIKEKNYYMGEILEKHSTSFVP